MCSYEWTRGRLLASVGGTTFEYDAKGRRTKKGSTEYYYDGDRLIAEIRPTGTLYFFYDESGVCGMRYNNTNYEFIRNIFGDVVAICNEAGGRVAFYSYDAWGNCTVEINQNNIANINPFRYRGYYYDTESGLYYLMSRYYDPSIGQFISMDTQEYLKPDTIGGVDLYAYCNNNPVMYVDPTGYFWKALGMTIAAIATVAVVATAVALTAGAAAVAIAGAVGASSVATLAVGGVVATTALASGLVVGTSEVINQGIDKGFENINILSTAIQTASGGFDGAMIAGAVFLPKASTQILAFGRIILSGLTSYAYGYSEGYDNETIKGNVERGMALTAAMTTLMFLPGKLSWGSLILQPFKTSGVKIGASIFKFLLGE